MWIEIVIWLEEYGTWLVIHRNGSFHQNEVSPLWYIYIADQWRIQDLPKDGVPSFPKNCMKLLQLDGSHSKKWRDRWRAKWKTVYTFRWWTVASDRCASFKQIDGQIKNWKRNCLYFAMMNCCCKQMWVLQRNSWTDLEPTEKLFLLCDGDLLLQTDVSPSNKFMYRSRTEGENLSTLRWWSIAADGSPSFKDI